MGPMDYYIKRQQIIDLLHRHCEMMDNFDCYDWADQFTDDCCYRLIPRDNYEKGLPMCLIDDNKERLLQRMRCIAELWHLEKFRETRFLSNIQVSFPEEDLAVSKSNFAVYRTNSEGLTSLHMVGRLEDKLVRLDGRWRIKERLAILESYMVTSNIILPP